MNLFSKTVRNVRVLIFISFYDRTNRPYRTFLTMDRTKRPFTEIAAAIYWLEKETFPLTLTLIYYRTNKTIA